MAKTARRKGALRRPAVSADSDRGKAREAAVAAVQLALSWNHPGGLAQELKAVSSVRRAKVIEQMVGEIMLDEAKSVWAHLSTWRRWARWCQSMHISPASNDPTMR